MSSPFEELGFELDQSATSEADIEVAGAIDAFVSLEEIAPGTHWSDALADAWGVPTSRENAQKSGLWSRLASLKFPWLR